MGNYFSFKLVSLFTFLNLSVLGSSAYHGTEQSSGATVSVPSYSDPVNFGIYLALPAGLLFLAVQQPLERKLEDRWRKREPPRKYSSIVAAGITLLAVISPLFHSFSTMNQGLYTGFIAVLAVISLSAYKWGLVQEKLPV